MKQHLIIFLLLVCFGLPSIAVAYKKRVFKMTLPLTVVLRSSRSKHFLCPALGAVFFLLSVCGPSRQTERLQKDAMASFGIIPSPSAELQNSPIVSLGKKLFSDTILSMDQKISCASCHSLTGAGVDHQRVSSGIKGQTGSRNAPTVYNAALHTAQFWDGRAKDIQEQAGKPILNPIEMGMPDEDAVIKRLQKHPEYPELFSKAFPQEKESLTYKNMTWAIGDFEKTLITSDRFDRFQKGDLSALNRRELKGLQLFMEIGCVSCHNGPLLGGNSFRRLGGVRPYDNMTDTGRFQVTGIQADMFVFKVPSLRNAGVTGPYFHDGAVPSLELAIETMGVLQFGRQLNRLQKAYLADFIRTMTDSRFEVQNNEK